jgi:hypothetical protein
MSAAGERVELARYQLRTGERVLYGQRINGAVAVVDVPVGDYDRVYLIERHLGEYVVDEELPDGRLVIRADTSAEAIRRRAGLEPVSAAEFAEHFDQLPGDDEG